MRNSLYMKIIFPERYKFFEKSIEKFFIFLFLRVETISCETYEKLLEIRSRSTFPC